MPSRPFSPRYALPLDEMQALTKELLRERASTVPDQHRFVGIEVDGQSQFSNIGRHIERVVFEASFGNDADQMTAEYGPYERASTFFLSIDRRATMPSGALRAIRHSDHGFKTLNDAEQPPFSIREGAAVRHHAITNLATIWDVGTVAVLPQYRRGEGPVSVQLYRALYLSARGNGIEHMVSIIDDGPLDKLRGYLGIPFVALAGSSSGPYLGSEKSHAVYGSVPTFYRKMRRHRWTVRGLLARKALQRLVNGTEDDSLRLLA